MVGQYDVIFIDTIKSFDNLSLLDCNLLLKESSCSVLNRKDDSNMPKLTICWGQNLYVEKLRYKKHTQL